MTTATAPPLAFVVAPRVSTEGNHYVVLFGDEEHIVRKDKTCSCQVPSCRAVAVVKDYLLRGGQRASVSLCPICGSETARDRSLSTCHTIGWRCSRGGREHYFQARMAIIAEGWKKRLWIFPPVSGCAGVPASADGEARRISEESHARWAREGYDPAA